MKKLFVILFFITQAISFAQQANTTANDYFFSGAKDYCNNKTDNALATVTEGLSKFPNDRKLKELYEKLKKKKEDEKKKKEDEQKKQEQQNKKDNQQQQQSQNKQQNQKNNQPQQQHTQKQPVQLSKEEVEKLLNAIGAEESKIQDKVKKGNQMPTGKKTQKDW